MNQETFLSDFYRVNGYGVIPGVFVPEEISAFRKEIIRIFEKEPKLDLVDNPNIRGNPLERYPELRKIFGNGKILAGLKAALGQDCEMIWGGSLHDSCLHGGWHRDTDSMEFSGRTFHFSPDFHLVTVAVYFQDNHEEYAGGLDVVPNSWAKRTTWWQKLKTNNRKVKYVLSHLDRRGLLPAFVLHKKRDAHTIESKAGDVVFFNMKCEHRPTKPRTDKIPDSNRKLALFFAFGKKNDHVKMYMNYLSGHLPDNMKFAYSDGYRAELSAMGVSLAAI